MRARPLPASSVNALPGRAGWRGGSAGVGECRDACPGSAPSWRHWAWEQAVGGRIGQWQPAAAEQMREDCCRQSPPSPSPTDKYRCLSAPQVMRLRTTGLGLQSRKLYLPLLPNHITPRFAVSNFAGRKDSYLTGLFPTLMAGQGERLHAVSCQFLITCS